MSRRILTACVLLSAWACRDAGDEAQTKSAALQDTSAAPIVQGGGAAAAPGAAGVSIARDPASGPAGQWRLPALDYANSRYSELNQINTSNVSRLRQITVISTGIPRGHEGQPLIVDNTMYVVLPYPNDLLAIDLTKPAGALKWKYMPNPDPQSVGVACCDVVNRGASYADGKIVFAALDAIVHAVDANTGRLVWKTKVGEISRGETLTMAPLIVKDKVIVGNSGAELGVRGWIKALSLADGSVQWTAYNTGPDSATLMLQPEFRPFYESLRSPDLGRTTWPGDQWQLGGATVWGWISYDPELDLLYYGTGNPGVWNPDLRPGDNKWSSSIIARDPDDGRARWAFQIVPHDAWDYDEIMENILVDMPWNGTPRKLLVHPGRTGFVFVLDRETGELLSANKFVEAVNWANGYDLRTGTPDINLDKRTHMGRITHDICPASTGAKEFVPSAVSPRTGFLYIPAMNLCMNYEGMEANYIEGTPYLGAEVMMYPGPGGFRGELIAWDMKQQRRAWAIREDFPVHSGVLVTAGDVVFYGTMDGWFKAADARTGAVLWQVMTGSGVVSNPVTYLGPDGRQYVAVYSGVGGWLGANAFPSISADDPTAALGVTGSVADLKQVTAPGGVIHVFGF